MEDIIKFKLKTDSGETDIIEVPDHINLNLMEVLKASDYAIAATCGGLALCATCHVEILEGMDQLNKHSEAELDMLDTLPSSTENSRLACQIKVGKNLENIVLKLKESTR